MELGCFAACALEKDSVSFIAFSRQGNIITCNKAFMELTGYTREKIAVMKWPDEFTQGIERTALSESIARLKAESSHRCEASILKKDSSGVPIEMFLHAFGENGAPQCYYSFITDIVERKRIEGMLRQSREALEKRVAERTEELDRSTTALDMTKTQAELYLDVLSHDIRNLNQAILGYLEMALEMLNPSGESREMLTRPIDLLNNSSRLIDNVKKLRSISAGMPNADVDLGKMLNTLIEEYSGQNGKKATINYEVPDRCRVKGNIYLREVFVNLIDNAVKHSNGPVNININVTEHPGEGKKFYRVSVEDDGPGLCNDLKVKLFSDLKDQTILAGRRGLGLQLSRAIVDALHGRIWVEDRVPGNHHLGCRFVVVLPAVEE